MTIFIVGIGSHAEVVRSILIDKEVAFLSYGDEIPREILQPYAGRLCDFKVPGPFIVAVGDNSLRKKIVLEILSSWPNATFINAISKQSFISPDVRIGVGNVVCMGAHINLGTVIGDHSIFNTNCSVDHHNDIRSYVHVAPNCALCGHVTLHEGVFLGVGSSVTPKINIRPWSSFKAQSLVKQSTNEIPMYDVLMKSRICVQEALDSGWISSRGKFLDRAQKELEALFKVKHVLLVSNGTCATHCLFIALKERYPNITKIYVPNNVYVAAINSALFEYPLEVLEVLRINPDTLNIETDEWYFESLEKDAVVLIVHNVGNIINVPRLKSIRPDLIFLEDACEAFGGSYEGLPAGSFEGTLCSSMSFFANKTITGGELGCVMTNDSNVHQFLSRKINQGNTSVKYVHDIVAYNYRATNLAAGVLCDQLIDLPEILSKKKKIFDTYGKVFPRTQEPKVENANWIMPVYIKGNPSFEAVEAFFKARAIDIRPMFYPLNAHAHLRDIKIHSNEIAEKVNREWIMIPSFPNLSTQEVEYIIFTIQEYKKTLEK